MCRSRANALTIRIPEILSSTSAVSSASRCCDLLHRRPRAPVVPRRREHHDGHGRQRERRQPRLDREHHHARQQDRERVLGQEDQSVAEEEADRLQVDRRPRHQLAGLLARRRTRARAPGGAGRAAPAGRTRPRRRPRPAISRRTTVSPSRRIPAPTIAERQRQDRRLVARRLDRIHRLSHQPRDRARSSPSPARRRRAIRLRRGDRGAGIRAAARRWTRSLTIQSEVWTSRYSADGAPIRRPLRHLRPPAHRRRRPAARPSRSASAPEQIPATRGIPGCRCRCVPVTSRGSPPPSRRPSPLDAERSRLDRRGRGRRSERPGAGRRPPARSPPPPSD